MYIVQIKFFVPNITALEEDPVIWMEAGQHALHVADSTPGRVGRRAGVGIRAGRTATTSTGIVHVIHRTFDPVGEVFKQQEPQSVRHECHQAEYPSTKREDEKR